MCLVGEKFNVPPWQQKNIQREQRSSSEGLLWADSFKKAHQAQMLFAA